MPTQNVMDQSGHTTHSFDRSDRLAVVEAEKRFAELTGAGFTAAVRTGNGESTVVRSFDPNAEEVLFVPRYVGG